MKKILFFALFSILVFCSGPLLCASVDELAKTFPVVSVYYSVPDNDQRNFADVVFRFGWNEKKPYKIAVQIVNRSYSERKIKFAIKDVSSKKMVVLDAARNSRFGTETMKPNSIGAIWSGPVDNVKDSFSLHVWNITGDEFDKVSISIKDQQ